MSEDNEYDNEWGTKKQKYYSMNKRENNLSESDSDFIEEEKEAIRLQKLRAQKIKKAQILNEEEEISEKSDDKNKNKKIENDLNKEISFKTVEIDTKKILDNFETLKYNLEEIQTTEDEIKILEENKKINLANTLEYLKQYKKINLLNTANVLFNIISTLNKKMTGHHPSIKNIAVMNFLLNKNAENNEEIQKQIEQIIINLQEKNENNIELNEYDEENEEIEDDYLNEENEANEEENEEDNEEEEEEEEIEENEDIINNKKYPIINSLLPVKQEKIKKPSFLSKKKNREKDDTKDKEIDKRANENFDISSENEEEDSFIKEQYKSFNKLNKEKELIEKEKEEKEKKEIKEKNDFAIRKANKEVLKARGIYRKRKKYQGNAKLMNREKFYKKEKERRKLVKEYEGKPDVYMGEATGIRRDLIRSTKIH